MSVNKYLTWHATEWRRLWDGRGGLPHAVLLAGVTGVGKSLFAMALAQRMLCQTPRQTADVACGECVSCRLFSSGNHPDLRHVRPEAEASEAEGEGGEAAADKKKLSSQILIGQIRALEDFVYVGSHLGGRRVILIEPAEAMNISAENAVLKILEEPPEGVCFILVSDRWRKLLPTIRSRCRTLMFGRPSLEDAKQWLNEQGSQKVLPLLPLMGGAPIRALEEFEKGRMEAFDDVAASLLDAGDFLTLAARWEAHVKKEGGLKMEELVATIQKGLFDLAYLKTTGRARFLANRQAQAESVAQRADIGNILGYYKELLGARALASHPLNPRLFLDDIAARYLRAIAPPRT